MGLGRGDGRNGRKGGEFLWEFWLWGNWGKLGDSELMEGDDIEIFG